MKELEMAYKQISADTRYALIWNPILQNITPSFVKQCEWAIERGKELIEYALDGGMFKDAPADRKKDMLDQAVARLSELTKNKTHSKHFHYDDCKDMGLNVEITSLLHDLSRQYTRIRDY
jgi:hypothetical protein